MRSWNHVHQHQGTVAVGVELVDDVGAGVEPVLERGVGTERAHDAAVAGVLEQVRLDPQQPAQRRALEGHAPGLAEDDAGLAPGRRDGDLGLGLAVGGEEVVGRRRSHAGLAVLPRQPEPDLRIHPQTGGRVDLERLPPELALPGLEHEGLARPASLRMAHVAFTERRETRTAGALIGDHRSAIGSRSPMDPIHSDGLSGDGWG